MGKKQHQKDKLYLTHTEWGTLYGGKKAAMGQKSKQEFQRLPYDHCALSLIPFENPLCDADGNIFDLVAIVPYLKKFKCNPITGKHLDSKSLIKLNFYKNAEGKYHCPVLYKVFTNSTHIVAIKKTGNVFSYQAVEQLNIKPKHFRDLLNDEPFTRTDIITLQDPANLDKFNIATFHHVRLSQSVPDEDDDKKGSQLRQVGTEVKEILKELEESSVASTSKAGDESSKVVRDKWNSAHFSTGAMAAGFTSTVMEPSTRQEAAILDQDVIRYERAKKKKGYARLVTNLGHLNVELHCDIVPKTCDNFLQLCRCGYYDNSKFFRSIRHFMIQGGDPEGTGKGGESAWGKPFKDEFHSSLTHTGRGILSMANSGPDSNKSQFFITFRSCRHLDKKHSVFGRVVGGLETLSAMENTPTDGKDRPVEDIFIYTAVVFVDPFHEVEEQMQAEREKAEEEERTKAKKEAREAEVRRAEKPAVFKSGVGKYINPEAMVIRATDKSLLEEGTSAKKQKMDIKYEFKDFSIF